MPYKNKVNFTPLPILFHYDWFLDLNFKGVDDFSERCS